MKTRIKILQLAALLIIVGHLASCSKIFKTDNRRPDKHKYRRAGRAW
jgi:hypothetical protein